jgi:hypothetical protein
MTHDNLTAVKAAIARIIADGDPERVETDPLIIDAYNTWSELYRKLMAQEPLANADRQNLAFAHRHNPQP